MNIEEVYQRFDLKPLGPDDEKLYPGLFAKFLKDTKKRLILQKLRNKKILMPGHKGAGKSTFLNLLADDSEIQKEFFVVNYSINEIGNPYDFSHYDFLLSLALKGTEMAQSRGIKISDTLLDEIKTMVNILQETTNIEFTDEMKSKLGGGAEISIGIPDLPIISNWIKAKVYAALQLSEEKRKQIRETYKVKPHELMSAVNNFLVALCNSSGKSLLYIVDDMDKIPLQDSFNLFAAQREFLEKPEANIIYIINISLACSERYARITAMGEDSFFPSLKLKKSALKDAPGNKKRSIDDKGADTIKLNKENLKKLIYKWCPQEFIDRESVSEIIKNGGGNIEQTIRLLWYALDHVVIETGTQKIGTPDVERAIIRRRNEYQPNKEHLELLRKVESNCLWVPEKDESVNAEKSAFLDMIDNLSILEYRNGDDKWRSPNPVLTPMRNR